MDNIKLSRVEAIAEVMAFTRKCAKGGGYDSSRSVCHSDDDKLFRQSAFSMFAQPGA